ncbi:MAG TPA: RluA family pseudouridine synthase [Bacteroidales bacterium]|nr:RluA family pseudouridine synthase [Bacteroidales bacterium]
MPDNLTILYEDNHIIAVNKTQHDLVQKDITGDEALDDKIKNYLKEKYKKPGAVFLGVVHRLDRPVTGVVLFARTSKALSRLTTMFREGEISKTYWAIVKNAPPNESDRLVHYMVRNAKQNKSYCHETAKPGSKQAILGYRLAGRSQNYFLLEINLETGRHHQIRSQLSTIGCPIKGDLKYGFPRSNPDGGISLHSRQIRFMHPVTGIETIITAEPPEGDALWTALMESASK